MTNFADINIDLDSGIVTSTGGIIREAIAAIKAEGLNKLRCALTGAPYGTIDDDEIHLALHPYTTDKAMTPDHLVDKWHLKMLTLNNGPAPALRAADKLSLSSIRMGKHGRTRVINYCLTRLFFPAKLVNHQRVVSSQRAVERMVFASRVYDALALVEDAGDSAWLDIAIQQLSACDSYCALTAWQNITAFKSARAAEGIHKTKNAIVATWFDDPESFEPTHENMQRLTAFMLTLLCHMAGNDHEMPTTGDRLAASVFEATTEAVPTMQTRNQKNIAPGSSLNDSVMDASGNTPDWYNTLNKAAQTRYAYSATYGPGTPMRGDMPGKRKSDSKTAKPKAAKPAKAKTFKSQKANAFAAAFGNLDIKI